MLRKVGRFLFGPIRHWRIGLAVLIGLMIAYVVAGQVLLMKLAAQREAIVAAGARLSLKDFALDLPDSDNAAIVYAYAASAIENPQGPHYDWQEAFDRYRLGSTCGCVKAESDEPFQPLTAEEEATLGRFIDSNEKVFAALEEAHAKPACQFGHYDAAPEVLANPAAVLPKPPGVRDFARLCSLRAVWEARHRNPAGAHHWITVGLHMANGLDNDPLLLMGLVSTACQSLMLEALGAVLCETPAPEPLPADLMEEVATAADRTRIKRFYEGERCFSNSMDLLYGRVFPQLLLVLNQMAALDATTEVIAIAGEPDETRHAQLVSQFSAQTLSPQTRPSVFNAHRVLGDILRPALGRSILSFDRGIAMARCAQTAIALKQYKAKHGAYPEGLEVLAPDYMKAVPADPFTGSALHYRREGTGFVLYSVGQDGRDDGGKPGRKGRGDLVWCTAS